jgi:NADPH-dependent glutamate synthase beta subunit-like oxidoreductase
LIKVESEETGRTSHPGIFAAGDNVRGADLVVTAIGAARKAAVAMDEYLREKMLEERASVGQIPANPELVLSPAAD